MPKSNFYPVILAGGRGTRFWPLSRRKRAKQVLALDGSRSMLQQSVARLRPLAPEKNFWVITNGDLEATIRRQLPKFPKQQIIAEPVGRNTAPAIGLAAFILLRRDPEAVIGMFPSDHVITNAERFRKTVTQASELAAQRSNMIVMGIKPTGPETGYGYIEVGGSASNGVSRVRRFTEKPNREKAEEFLRAGNYFWNSGMFIWSAATLADALREHLPKTAALLEEIAAAWGTRGFEKTFRRLYPKCENISVDYAVLEPRSAKGENASHLFCIPADFGWSDLGSWSALYEHRASDGGNVVDGTATFALDADGNYIHAPGKFVAAVGVKDLVIVETEDALLVTTRGRAQDVGKVVKHLEEEKKSNLL